MQWAWPLRALGLAAAACAGNCAYAAHYYRPVPQFPGDEYTPSKRRLLDVGDEVGTHPLPPLPAIRGRFRVCKRALDDAYVHMPAHISMHACMRVGVACTRAMPARGQACALTPEAN